MAQKLHPNQKYQTSGKFISYKGILVAKLFSILTVSTSHYNMYNTCYKEKALTVRASALHFALSFHLLVEFKSWNIYEGHCTDAVRRIYGPVSVQSEIIRSLIKNDQNF